MLKSSFAVASEFVMIADGSTTETANTYSICRYIVLERVYLEQGRCIG